MLNSPAVLEFSRLKGPFGPSATSFFRQLSSRAVVSRRPYTTWGFSSNPKFLKFNAQDRLSKQIESERITRHHGTHIDRERAKKLTIRFVDKQGREKVVTACHGENVLELAHSNDVEIEGACEGGLACSTCHVIIDTEENYEKFESPSIREEDLLDVAPGLSETSRLCCQLNLDADKHDGITFILPKLTRNFYVDGFVSKPH